jgi:transcriptional regulator with XRE-family HTH domain
MADPSHPQIGPRIRAARHLAGLTDVPSLAAALKANGVRKLGATKLRRMEREQDASDVRDLEAIADACGLPLAWFSADLSRLPEISEDPRRVIARETAAAVERAAARRAGRPADRQPPLEGAQ